MVGVYNEDIVKKSHSDAFTIENFISFEFKPYNRFVYLTPIRIVDSYEIIEF